MARARRAFEATSWTHPAAKARALAPWLAEQAARIEQARRLPEDVVERLVEADLFRMTQPLAFGGLGLPPRDAWEAVFEVARGCASCAWVVGLGAANVLIAAKFSAQAQADLFLGGRPAIFPMLTGGVAQGTQARRVPGGIELEGRWRYASGIDAASWVGLLVRLPVGEDGASEPHVVFVPAEAFAVNHASWDVLGMRGTGSKDIALPPTFVPEHRWMRWAALQAGERHPTCPNDEPGVRAPLNAVNAMSIAAPMLGVAAAVAAEFRALVARRVSAGTGAAQMDDKIAHIDVATAEATMAMLKRELLADADLVVESGRGGAALDPEARAAIRMRLAVGSRLALAAAQRLFAAAGGSLLPSGTRMERLFRDLHAMSSHFLLQPEPIGEAYGRLLLGLPVPPTVRL